MTLVEDIAKSVESSGGSFIILFMTVVVLLLVIQKYKWKHYAVWKAFESFDGAPTLPLLGNALLLNKDNHELFQFAEDYAKKYGNISRLWLFHKPYVLVADADLAEKILSGRKHLDKGDDMHVFQRWWGSGLLTAPAEKWKSQRKLLNHTFSHSVLMDFLDIFNKESSLMAEKLGAFSFSGEPFNFIPFATECTLNIICETAMGKKLTSDGSANKEYISAVTGMYHILLSRMTRPWLRPDFVWRLTFLHREQKYLEILHGFTEKVIREKRETRQKQSKRECGNNNLDGGVEGQKVHMAFMDYLLDLSENGHTELTDEQIRSEVGTFMAAGHDTTATAVNWTLFLLATYPQHQRKVQEELSEIFSDDPHRPPNSGDLSQLTYLSLCIKEALRIYPIVPFNFRKTSEPLRIDDKRTIPKGVNVVIMPYLIHKDPQHFSKPEEFIPERFLAENCLQRHPFSYIPFSLGPRNCIGQKFGTYEAKVMLVHLLRNYNWTTLDKPDDIKLDLDLVIRPMNGIRFMITKR